MNDTLKKADRKEARPGGRPPERKWTMTQRVERLETAFRLQRRRLKRRLAAGAGRRQERRPAPAVREKRAGVQGTAQRPSPAAAERTQRLQQRQRVSVPERRGPPPAAPPGRQRPAGAEARRPADAGAKRPAGVQARRPQAVQPGRERPAAEARQASGAWARRPQAAQTSRERPAARRAERPAGDRRAAYETRTAARTAPAHRSASRGRREALSPWERLGAEARRIRRRWHHIRREQRAQRFPESNRMLIQLVLLAGGLLPMLGSNLREKLMGRHRRAVRRTNGFLARFEGRRKLRPVAFFAIVALVAGVTIFCSFYTYGATVTYDGELVGKVSSKRTAENAVRELEKLTASALGGSYTISSSLLQYTNELLPRSELVDTETLQETLSENIGLVTYGYSLYVDGSFIGATPYQGALNELLTQMSVGVSDENTIYCDFQEDVDIQEGYVPTERIMNLGYIAETLYSTKTDEVTYTIKGGDTWSEIAEDHGMTMKELSAKNPGYDINHISIGEVLTMSAAVPYLTLKVTQQESYLSDIPYEIEYTDDPTRYKGDTKVTSPGQYGKADVTANVTYINGEETERTVLSYVHLAEPVTEQRLRGTKERPSWYPTGTFRWPCSGTITSRFGYRSSPGGIGSTNHKGIDIANRYGTAVCASDGGTVIYAGWMGGYGYMVQIDHGNGVVTYYGHNSSLLVKKGQHVYPGQQIARMGSTGNSTGNHCHFEIRVNGVSKNPLNYLP